ncbi:retrovirus-related pol polyprotein from transposon TNT 1-94 [Tanacetum coccineum]
MALTTYANADHAGCQDTRRSTSGSAQFLGDKLVSWSSKKQTSTSNPFTGGTSGNGVVELYSLRTEYQLADILLRHYQRRFEIIYPHAWMKCMKPETLKSLQDE